MEILSRTDLRLLIIAIEAKLAEHDRQCFSRLLRVTASQWRDIWAEWQIEKLERNLNKGE